MISQDGSLNALPVIDPDFVEFADEARRFYRHLQEMDLTKEDPNEIIVRPYSFQMTKEFAIRNGFDCEHMYAKSEYFGDIVRFFFTGLNDKHILPPHLDTYPELGVVPGCININLINCDENTTTKWFRVKSGMPTYTQNLGGQIQSRLAANFTPECTKCELELVEEHRFSNDTAYLFRTSRWHEVINEEQKERVIISFLFKPPMIWDDLVEHCKEINII